VPSGVTNVHIQATGAAGMPGQPPGNAGGKGDEVSATLAGLTAGQSLYICVDSGGGSSTIAGTGGGASGVSLGSEFSSPVLVAGGGGGGGVSTVAAVAGVGGNAGYPNGQSGGNGLNGASLGSGGGGATAASPYFGSGGARGANLNSLSDGGNGALFTSAGPGLGGTGGLSDGGGGGGGYAGGGGGGGGNDAGAGGGGGSDYCADPYLGVLSPYRSTSVSGCTVIAGAGTQTGAGSATGDAQIVLTYTIDTKLRASATVNQKGVISFQATLTARPTGAAISGQTVSFSGAGGKCSALTQSNGDATCQAKERYPGKYTWFTASYAGSATYRPNSDQELIF